MFFINVCSQFPILVGWINSFFWAAKTGIPWRQGLEGRSHPLQALWSGSGSDLDRVELPRSGWKSLKMYLSTQDITRLSRFREHRSLRSQQRYTASHSVTPSPLHGAADVRLRRYLGTRAGLQRLRFPAILWPRGGQLVPCCWEIDGWIEQLSKLANVNPGLINPVYGCLIGVDIIYISLAVTIWRVPPQLINHGGSFSWTSGLGVIPWYWMAVHGPMAIG